MLIAFVAETIFVEDVDLVGVTFECQFAMKTACKSYRKRREKAARAPEVSALLHDFRIGLTV